MAARESETSASNNHSNNQNHNSMFQEAFAPLAHHIFPDGCPQQQHHLHDDTNDDDDDAMANNNLDVSSVWPPRKTRVAVSATQALRSISALSRISSEIGGGFTPEQLYCIVLVALETLPKKGVAGAGSALVDGTSRHFCHLIKTCCVPRTTVPAVVVTRLLAAVTRCGDGDGAVVVLRFLTLSLRSGRLDATARRILLSNPLYYGVVFFKVKNEKCCADAVRLLHAMTRRRHVRLDRARKLREWYDQNNGALSLQQEGQQQQDKDNHAMRKNRSRLAPIWLLLQLYARYDPQGCGRYFPSHQQRLASSVWSRCFQIPDRAWEEAFLQKHHGRRMSSTTGNHDHAAAADDDDDKKPAAKRRRTTQMDDKTKISSFSLEWLEDAFDGVHSFSMGLLVGNRERKTTTTTTTQLLRASDLLLDDNLQHIVRLASQDASARSSSNYSLSVSETELIRLQACLPYMLNEEWYPRGQTSPFQRQQDDTVQEDSSDSSSSSSRISMLDDTLDNASMDSVAGNQDKASAVVEQSRMRLLQALSSMAAHSDSLLPEVESFLLEEILPQWDGSDRMGLVLCHDLLPKIRPMMTFSALRSSVLRHLALLFTYGSPRIQYAIVSGALAGLLRQWARLDWSGAVTTATTTTTTTWLQNPPNNEVLEGTSTEQQVKHGVLRDLVQWTDNLVLRGFLLSDGHDLLRQASLDFFDAVASVALKSESFLGAPSPALCYRWLLSKSMLSIDGICGLLCKFRGVFQRIKSANHEDLERMECRDAKDRISIFNCFVWDFCSVLWRCSPLPTRGDHNDNVARSKSILFTDLSPSMLKKLRSSSPPTSSSSVDPAAALSITHGAVFAGCAKEFLMRQNVDNVDPSMLRGKLKLKYLDYLREERGLEGVYRFLTTFVASLADREARRKQAHARRAVT